MHYVLPFLSFLLFYWGFAASITVYRLWVKGTLNLWNKVLFAPLLVLFFAMDVLLNWTIVLCFMGLPPADCFTISRRFAFYKANPCGVRTDIAVFVCNQLLNTIDPTGQHC